MNFEDNKEGGIWEGLEGRKEWKNEALLKFLKRIIKGETHLKKKNKFHTCM